MPGRPRSIPQRPDASRDACAQRPATPARAASPAGELHEMHGSSMRGYCRFEPVPMPDVPTSQERSYPVHLRNLLRSSGRKASSIIRTVGCSSRKTSTTSNRKMTAGWSSRANQWEAALQVRGALRALLKPLDELPEHEGSQNGRVRWETGAKERRCQGQGP